MSVCRVGCGMSEPTGTDNVDQNKDSIYDYRTGDMDRILLACDWW